MTPSDLRAALFHTDPRPPATTGPLTVGVYEATASFRSIAQHACVCHPTTLALVAVTGPADDPQSQADADLFAAAPALLLACRQAAQQLRTRLIVASPWGADLVDILEAALALAKGAPTP